MIIVGLVLAGLAAALHVFIFYLESVAWTGPQARAVFGTTPQEAEATKLLAFNQGFYNLFLALAVFIGVALMIADVTVVGATLIFAGAGSMAAAAVVLLISSPDKAGAALKQGLLPTAGIVLLALGLWLGG